MARVAYAATIGLWIARYLGPQDFGRFSFAQAIVALMAPIGAAGLNHVLTRAFIESPERSWATAQYALRVRLAAGLVASVLAVTGAVVLRPDDLAIAGYVGILSVGTVARTFAVYEFVQFSLTRGDVIAKIRVVFRVALAASHLVGILTGQAVVYFVVCLAAEVTLQFSVGWIFTKRRLSMRGNRLELSERRALRNRGLLLVASGIAATVNLRIDQVMIGAMLGDADLGLYSAAVRISEILYVIPEAVVISLFPAVLAARSRSAAEYQMATQLTLDLMFWSAIVLAGLASILATPVIPLLLGSEFAGAVPILLIHVWASVFVFTRAVFSKWLIAEDILRFSLITQVAGGVINVIVNLVLIPSLGGEGAAIATLLSYGTSSFLILLLFPRTRGFARLMVRSLTGPARASRILQFVLVSPSSSRQAEPLNTQDQ